MAEDAKSAIPFGYTLVEGATEDTPSGPPLLDNNESGYLQNFFDNPNNIDPSFLGNQHHGDRTTAPNRAFPAAGRHQQDWMMNSNADFHAHPQMDVKQQQAFAHAAATQQAQYAGTYGHAYSRAPHSASDDVYAAARLLQGNQGGHNSGSGGDNYTAHKVHGYGYAQQSQEDYNQVQRSYSYSNGSQASPPQQQQPQPPPQQQQPPQSAPPLGPTSQQQQQQALSGERADPGKRPRPLNFGSDSKFRMNKYQAPKNEPWPDQDLVAAVLAANPSGLQHNPWDQNEGREGNGDSPGLERKRRRSHDEGDESEDDGESGTESHKRKRSSGEDDGDDAKVRDRSSKKKSGRSGSPGKGRSTPTSANKPSKENLSEEQKRANHIQSEQKRRNLIRQGFDDANRMVPELRAGGFSKSNMLLEAAKFMRELKTGNESLYAQIEILDKG